MNQKSNRGITLVALVVTIVVLVILAQVTVNVLYNSGVITQAEKASEVHKKGAQIELEAFDSMNGLIEKYAGKKIWEGEITGEDGSLVIPVSLNDCSYIYKIEMESELYTGEAILYVYGAQGNYIGIISADDQTSYSWQLRNLLSDGKIPENVAIIQYNGQKIEENESNAATLTYDENSEVNENDISVLGYDTNAIGSEITIKKITAYKKEYSIMGNLLLKLRRSEDITADDLIPFVEYCVNSKELGYQYVNENVTPETVDQTIGCASTGVAEQMVFNESLEKELLKNITINEKETIVAIEKAIRDEILYTFYAGKVNNNDQTMESSVLTNFAAFDPYTMADYIEENKYLTEFSIRTIGNTIIPFTIMYMDEILTDLNTNGNIPEKLNADTNQDRSVRTSYLYNCNEYAGLCCRYYADIYAVVYANYSENMSENDLALLQETYEVSQTVYNGEIYYWYNIYGIYLQAGLNDMYGQLFNAGIKINVAGLRLGYYAAILPSFSQLWTEYGFNFNDEYDITKDTKYIEQQGIQDFIN